MSKRNWDQIAATSGVVFVALYVLANVLVSRGAPSLSDPNAKWVMWVHHHTRELKLAAILVGLGLFAFLWFVGSLADALRRGGEQRLSAVATASGAAGVGLAAVGTTFLAALAHRITFLQPTLTKSVWEMTLVAFTIINFVGAALMYTAAAGSWRSNIFPRWYAWLSSLGALAVLVAGGALAPRGFYAPDGAYGLITTVIFLVWVFITSVLLVQKAGQDEAAAGASPA